MHYYAIHCEDNPENNIEKRRSVRPAHLQRLDILTQEGRLLTAGALYHEDGDNPFVAGIYGSLIVAKFEDLISARAWAAADPYITAGIYANVTIRPYHPVES